MGGPSSPIRPGAPKVTPAQHRGALDSTPHDPSLTARGNNVAIGKPQPTVYDKLTPEEHQVWVARLRDELAKDPNTDAAKLKAKELSEKLPASDSFADELVEALENANPLKDLADLKKLAEQLPAALVGVPSRAKNERQPGASMGPRGGASLEPQAQASQAGRMQNPLEVVKDALASLWKAGSTAAGSDQPAHQYDPTDASDAGTRTRNQPESKQAQKATRVQSQPNSDAVESKQAQKATRVQSQPDSNAVEATIAALRAAGVESIVFGELHDSSRNIDVIASILLGASEQGSVSYYKETNPAEGEAEVLERNMKVPAMRAMIAGWQVLEITGQRLTTHERFERAMATRDIASNMVINAQGGTGYDRFLSDPQFSVLHTGLAHAIAKVAQENHVLLPWTGAITVNPIHLEYPKLTDADHKRMADVFERSVRQKPTCLVMQSQIWGRRVSEDIELRRNDAHDYYANLRLEHSVDQPYDYVNQHFVIMDAPLGKIANVSLVCPASEPIVAAIEKLAAQYEGRTYVRVGLIDDPHNPQKHDDL